MAFLTDEQKRQSGTIYFSSEASEHVSILDTLSGSVSDTKDIPIKCSCCLKPLATLVVTRPDAKIKNLVTVLCPYCGDKSFRVEAFGIIHVGQVPGVSLIDVNTDVNTDDPNLTVQKLILNTTKKKAN